MNDVLSYVPFMLKGTWVTVEIFVLTLVLSLPLGFPFALGRNARFMPLRFLCRVYIWIFRGTPLLLQIFFFYYFFPIVFGIALNGFATVILTFVLNYAAYFAEIYRGGINSIDKGQYEAAYALGITRGLTMRDIILPQAMKAILPPVMNEAITLVKDTALASTIGTVVDLMKATNSAVNTLTSMMPFFIAALFYLILTALLTLAAGRLEKYFSRYDPRSEG